jgi:hypothetical protein
MEYSCVQLNDLSDEILMIIFKELSNIAVFYSLIGVSKRLNKTLHTIFTNRLTLLSFVPSHGIVRKISCLVSFLCEQTNHLSYVEYSYSIMLFVVYSNN